jgi:glutathione S-transferase
MAVMTSITLYSNPRSRGRIARWMLEEVGADYEVAWIDFDDPGQVAEFRTVNPMGKVPAIRHGDAVVTETAAICAYLADAFVDAGLAPPVARRADYYRWLFFAAGPLEAAITNQALGVQPTPRQQGFVGYGDLARTLDTLETALAGASWIAGDRFTAADVYVGSQIGFGLQFGTIDKRPAFADYVARATDRDAYRRAAEADDGAIAD